MLGISLSGEAEERLERESVDLALREAALIAARTDRDEDWVESDLDD